MLSLWDSQCWSAKLSLLLVLMLMMLMRNLIINCLTFFYKKQQAEQNLNEQCTEYASASFKSLVQHVPLPLLEECCS